MDEIQKNLELYLEKKRGHFPRFYFISNDELLQILANQTDLKAIEKQAKKCFENVNSFFLQDELAKEQMEQRERALKLEAARLEKKRRTETMQDQAELTGNDSLKPRRTLEASPTWETFDEIIDTSELNNIYGLVSTEGERFKFYQNKFLKIRHQSLIEEWMKNFEEEMMKSVRMKIKIAYNKYYDPSDDNNRNAWVLSHLS
jgi:hypothetical protein